MELIHLRGRFEDKRASLIQQNKPVPLGLLLVLLLLREQVYHRFELIRIIQMAVPEAMVKIRK